MVGWLGFPKSDGIAIEVDCDNADTVHFDLANLTGGFN
jgi:hypothetical protein